LRPALEKGTSDEKQTAAKPDKFLQPDNCAVQGLAGARLVVAAEAVVSTSYGEDGMGL